MIPHEKVYTGADFPPKNVFEHNSWYLYACYGEDFVGCPAEDYKDSVEYSEPAKETQDEQETISEFSPER